MKYFSLTLFFFVNGLSYAQNLVPNPGFEEYSECPEFLGGTGTFYPNNWYSPTTGSPDLFNSCSNGEQVDVPQNAFGWQYPRTGNGYVGGHTSDFISENNGREYVQCQLISPLEAGEEYQVSFYVSLADSASKACDNLGAYLSAEPISATEYINLPYIPQIVSTNNQPIVNTIDWVQIVDTLTAIGGEEYLTIGVFTNNQNTNWISVNDGWMDEAYYYIDDVSVINLSTISVEVISVSEDILVFPNPASEFVQVSSKEVIEYYILYSQIGQQVATESNLNNKHIQINTGHLVKGVYYLEIRTKTHSLVKRVITK